MQFQIPYNVYLAQYKYKYLTLYHALRDTIVSGTLPHGSQLPPTRDLAEQYQISRGIVTQVYDMLAAEGYVTSQVGQGTYVSFQHEHAQSAEASAPVTVLSAWGQRVDKGVRLPTPPDIRSHIPNDPHWRFPQPTSSSALEKTTHELLVDFGLGYTSMEGFPVDEWNREFYASVRAFTEKDRTEAFSSAGHFPLRQAIAQSLRRSRGIEAEAEDVVIVNGSTQAIALLTQLLIDPGDAIVVEDPGYSGIRQAVNVAGGHFIPAPVDAQGLQIDDWPARLLFVTPSRQFPTGAVLSLERRQELLQWATRRQAVIIEDDYDSEFRYKGRPIEPLKALDKSGRVAYLGTFSKTLFTDIRIGFIVLPAWLREPFIKARHLYEPHTSSLLQQRALAQFMNSGRYERHLRRMKRLYSQKQKVCLQELQTRLGRFFEVVESDAGLHVFAWWKGSGRGFELFLQTCWERGIRVPDAGRYQVQASRKGAIFGFAHLDEEQMRWAFEQMERVANEVL